MHKEKVIFPRKLLIKKCDCKNSFYIFIPGKIMLIFSLYICTKGYSEYMYMQKINSLNITIHSNGNVRQVSCQEELVPTPYWW